MVDAWVVYVDERRVHERENNSEPSRRQLSCWFLNGVTLPDVSREILLH